MTTTDFNELYKSFGYRKFKMSKFEPYDLYADYRDFLTSRELITFTDLDGTLLAMKPDITLSIIKNNTGEEKVYYNENVYRARNHHYREIQQVGVECVGKVDFYCEAEILAMAAKSLALISDRYVLRVSDVGFLDQAMAALGLSPSTEAKTAELFGAKNTAGLKALENAGEITAEAEKALAALMEFYAPFEQGIGMIEGMDVPGAPEFAAKLRQEAEVLRAFGVLDSIFLDFSLVNSMDYYNGIVFQGAVPQIPYELLFGGRYDRLPRKMGKDMDAIGFAIYLDEIDNYITPPVKYDVDYLLVYDGEDAGNAVKVAEAVRELTSRGYQARAVRRDMAESMQQRPRSRFTVDLAKDGFDPESLRENTRGGAAE